MDNNSQMIIDFFKNIDDDSIRVLIEKIFRNAPMEVIESIGHWLIVYRYYIPIGLLIASTDPQISICDENSRLRKWALKNKLKLLMVVAECSDVDILLDIRSWLKDPSLISCFDRLIEAKKQEGCIANGNHMGDIDEVLNKCNTFATLFESVDKVDERTPSISDDSSRRRERPHTGTIH